MDVYSNPRPSTWIDILVSPFSANIRRIRRSEETLDHIKCQLSDSYDIINLSETWNRNEIDSVSLILNGVQAPFRKDWSNNEGYGGMLTWVSIILVANRRPDRELDDFEAMWLEIRSHNNKFSLYVVYRVPNSDIIF